MLSPYHQKYLSRSDEDMSRRIKAKEQEFKQILKAVAFTTPTSPARIAVMGCGHRQFIKAHHRIFQDWLKKPVELTTFDITVEHLAGEERVIQHDCTQPLPQPPYDITLAHVVLKFIPREKQWDLIVASVNGLAPGGIAIHVLDADDTDLDTTAKEGYSKVPLEAYKQRFAQMGWTFQEIPIKTGPTLEEDALALVIRK